MSIDYDRHENEAGGWVHTANCTLPWCNWSTDGSEPGVRERGEHHEQHHPQPAPARIMPPYRPAIMDDHDPLLTPKEVGALYRVNPKTVTRWADAGKLTAVRTPGGHKRFKQSEVRRLLGITGDSDQ